MFANIGALLLVHGPKQKERQDIPKPRSGPRAAAAGSVRIRTPKQLPEPRTRIRSPQHSPRAHAGTQEGPQPSRATRSPAGARPALRAPAAGPRAALPQTRTRIRSRRTPPGPALVPRKHQNSTPRKNARRNGPISHDRRQGNIKPHPKRKAPQKSRKRPRTKAVVLAA